MDLRDLILNTPDLNDRKQIDVPQWPQTAGELFLRQMSAKEKEQYEQLLQSYIEKKPINFRAKVVAMVLVNKEGKRVFTDTDADKLSDKNSDAIDLIFEKWLEFSQLQRGALDDQKKD